MPNLTTKLDLANANRILTNNCIHYAIVDRDLQILLASSSFPSCGTHGTALADTSIFDQAPELIGSEEALQAILSGVSERLYFPMINREDETGEVTYYNMTVLPHVDPGGVIDGLLLVLEDMSEMARIEQTLTQHRNELSLLKDRLSRQNMQLAAANAELRQLDDLKSRFVSIAAHELRSPLSTISGYLDLLTDDDFSQLNDQQHSFAAAIRRSTDRLLETIEKLLDLTRITSGRLDIVLSLHEVEEVLQTVLSEVRPMADAKHQRLVLTIDAEMPRILCDKNRTTQVLHNLLSNAIKYTDDGGLIQLRAESAAGSGFIQLSVIDEGIGIPDEDKSRIFDTFFRASNIHQVSASGSGLGLNITRSLVELHSGEIWFESEVGVGTSFHVTFPAADGSPP